MKAGKSAACKSGSTWDWKVARNVEFWFKVPISETRCYTSAEMQMGNLPSFCDVANRNCERMDGQDSLPFTLRGNTLFLFHLGWGGGLILPDQSFLWFFLDDSSRGVTRAIFPDWLVFPASSGPWSGSEGQVQGWLPPPLWTVGQNRLKTLPSLVCGR